MSEVKFSSKKSGFQTLLLIVVLLFIGVWVAWGIYKNFGMKDETVTTRIVMRLKRTQRLVVGKYYFQVIADSKESAFFGLHKANILVKGIFETTVYVDLSEISPDDIDVDQKAKIINVRFPRPKLDKEPYISDFEIVEEDIRFYVNDEDLRNVLLESLNQKLKEKLAELERSENMIGPVKVFVEKLARALLNDEGYQVFVSFR